MTVTQIDLDDDALNEAMRLMGTTTKKETVNRALVEYVQQRRRLEAFDKLLAMGRRGDFDQAAEAHAAAKAARKRTENPESP
ncbi:type II toxin-antitoxin system VapB family antitoxin [Nocardia sp. NPDC059240]|uniref:type II toxin-antitoxin system VapB family antitoxin n=1 Tax=Nocardia sp. NPDC059240 TaxID=3346786 RepID=UPI0036B93B2E